MVGDKAIILFFLFFKIDFILFIISVIIVFFIRLLFLFIAAIIVFVVWIFGFFYFNLVVVCEYKPNIIFDKLGNRIRQILDIQSKVKITLSVSF